MTRNFLLSRIRTDNKEIKNSELDNFDRDLRQKIGEIEESLKKSNHERTQFFFCTHFSTALKFQKQELVSSPSPPASIWTLSGKVFEKDLSLLKEMGSQEKDAPKTDFIHFGFSKLFLKKNGIPNLLSTSDLNSKNDYVTEKFIRSFSHFLLRPKPAWILLDASLFLECNFHQGDFLSGVSTCEVFKILEIMEERLKIERWIFSGFEKNQNLGKSLSLQAIASAFSFES